MAYITVDSPVGRLTVIERDGAITRLTWQDPPPAEVAEVTPPLLAAAKQLAEFFAGQRDAFDLPLEPAGSAFQKAVWRAMLAIPLGQTLTYGEIAGQVGGVARAVGGACGANPIPVIIPCHRVVAAAGRLGGFSGAGGVATKRQLLTFEGALPPQLF